MGGKGRLSPTLQQHQKYTSLMLSLMLHVQKLGSEEWQTEGRLGNDDRQKERWAAMNDKKEGKLGSENKGDWVIMNDKQRENSASHSHYSSTKTTLLRW